MNKKRKYAGIAALKIIFPLILAIALLALYGCINNTMIKYYRPGGAEKIHYYVGGYAITVHLDAVSVYDMIGIDSFRVDIESIYTGKVKDTGQIDNIPVLKIDSVFIMIPSDSQRIYPALQDYSPGNITDFVHKKLHGPRYIFKRILLKEDSPDLILGLTVALYDRATDRKISSTKFEETLFRTQRKRYYLR